MSKMVNKVLGDPLGKLGYIVGGKWKDGVYWLRGWVKPMQRGSVQDYKDYKAGKISSMSYKQMNIRRAVLQVLGHIGRMNLTNWMDPVWGDYNLRHGVTNLTAMNQFIRNNASRLYYSLPNRDQEYNSTTNAPDLTKMLVSKGDLESTPIMTAVYTSGTGALEITFSSTCYTNGLPTDLSYAMVAKKPILESTGVTGTWAPKLFCYPPSRGDSKTRTDGKITLTLPTGLTAADLTAYLFFKDAAGIIGFSDSTALQVS
jgi:hypothetical protein